MQTAWVRLEYCLLLSMTLEGSKMKKIQLLTAALLMGVAMGAYSAGAQKRG